MARRGNEIPVEQRWRTLTWADLEDWAGLRSVERGRAYCRAGRVAWLCLTGAGELLAWVRGGERYATRVRLEDGGEGIHFRADCTCPVDVPGCKHAVGTVLAYLDALKHGRDVPLAEPSDPRLWLLEAPPDDPRTAVTGPVGTKHAAREQVIDELLADPTPSACEAALPHLRKLRELLLATGRAAEWDDYEAALRRAYWRRSRLLEVLDRLRTRPIIAA
jgi:uncharacterized Zn finger protein